VVPTIALAPSAADATVQRLRAAGLRVTAPRVAVLDALARHPHARADIVGDLARRRLGSLSRQATYDILDALVSAGIARRFAPAGGPARYETRVSDNHHHLVCRDCGAVVDVDCAVGEAPCLEPSDAAGYALDEAEVTYWGRCPDCRDATARNPSRKDAP
jgi:Fur family ferric uptake transcriptional regulator